MPNKRTERLEVLDPCKKLCQKLQIQGYILQWKRLDALDMNHISGSPDIEIWFPKDGNIWILMAECKAPMGGKLRPSQITYRNKYKKFNNVIYLEVKSVEELRQIVTTFSDFKSEELNEFKNVEL